MLAQHAWLRKRQDIFLDGTAEQLRNHTRRSIELEHEYCHRFPERVHDAANKANHANHA